MELHYTAKIEKNNIECEVIFRQSLTDPEPDSDIWVTMLLNSIKKNNLNIYDEKILAAVGDAIEKFRGNRPHWAKRINYPSRGCSVLLIAIAIFIIIAIR